MAIKINPAVARLEAYVPGEQPREAGFIKLNTNESPYPAAPAVIEAVRNAAAESALQKYPDPLAAGLRGAIAKRLGVSINEVLAGNGSDEVLRLICHAFLTPGKGENIGMLYPTYTLYRTLAEMFDAGCQTFRVSAPDYPFPAEAINADVRIFFLPNPNPPIGTFYPMSVIDELATARTDRVVVIDEAYVDFAQATSLDAFRKYDNVIITRTFSKSYSLAGMRVGFLLAKEPLCGELFKIKDSYNLNRLSLATAEAAWGAEEYYADKCALIRHDREYLAAELVKRGFRVPASRGNFVLAYRPDAAVLYKQLKERKILVRYFDAEALRDALRITVGTREEIDALLAAIDSM